MISPFKNKQSILTRQGRYMLELAVLLLVISFQSCDQEDPKPPNEEEVITTMTVTLTPGDGGMPVVLSFFDEDGENGSTEPIHTISGSLRVGTSYSAQIQLLNETVTPPIDVSDEVEEEGTDHLFCFSVSGDVSIEYDDADAQGMPLGLSTTWLTGDAGQQEVTITLRHQAGTKNGQCPGTGETDLEVFFGLIVQ
jgi:hypothetical protein